MHIMLILWGIARKAYIHTILILTNSHKHKKIEIHDLISNIMILLHSIYYLFILENIFLHHRHHYHSLYVHYEDLHSQDHPYLAGNYQLL